IPHDLFGRRLLLPGLLSHLHSLAVTMSQKSSLPQSHQNGPQALMPDIVQSAARRPHMDEAPVSPVDPDARFGIDNERRRYLFGYKLRVTVDAGSGLVQTLATTPANVQEVALAGALIGGDEQAVYADRGYDAGWLHRDLAERGIADGIIRRNRPKHKLGAQEIARNHALSLRRRPVEKLFGTLKRSCRLGRVPYFSLARNATALALACFAFNLRRWQAIATP
ncbi:MAG TPA: transposase, partial [Gammaproteobacteria bacterium]|nr:transposase [Gammaproteobacteria bacterium]